MSKLHKLLFSAAFAVSSVGFSAVAQDKPIDYDPFDWSGWYIGGYAGYASGHSSAVATVGDGFNGSAPDNRADVYPKGGAGGLLGGYNWQFDNVVLGIEGEVGFIGASDSFFDVGGEDYFGQAEYGLYGAITGRLGVAVDRTLLFGKAGYVLSHISTGYGDVDGTVGNRVSDPTASVFKDSFSHGYLVGGGVSYAFDDKWVGSVEYNYMKFGDHTQSDLDGDSYLIGNDLHLVKFSVTSKF